MNGPWCPRFVGGVSDELDVTLDIPFRPPVPLEPTVGGSRTSATGVPASYIVRRDRVLSVVFRVWESELVDFLEILAWGQQAELITWYPDALVPAESYEVYLEAPLAGTPIDMPRDPEFPLAHEITLQLRRADGQPWDLRYFTVTA